MTLGFSPGRRSLLEERIYVNPHFSEASAFSQIREVWRLFPASVESQMSLVYRIYTNSVVLSGSPQHIQLFLASVLLLLNVHLCWNVLLSSFSGQILLII